MATRTVKRAVRQTRAKPKKRAVKVRKKALGRAPQQYQFQLKDGRVLESIYDLVDELETMTEKAFNEYVSDMENGFADWVDRVFDENTLAEEIRHMRNKFEMQRSLLKHLVKELVKQ